MAFKQLPENGAEPKNETSTLQPHTVAMENRRSLTLTGVTRVLSCDETGALLHTSQGNLAVGGQNIQISELSVRTGEVHISGRVDYLQYSENQESAGGFFHRLLH